MPRAQEAKGEAKGEAQGEARGRNLEPRAAAASDAKCGKKLKCVPISNVGTVKWFNPTKGYGFIQPASGGKDVFVHISAVQKAGLSTLNEGQTIEYEEIANRGKTSAENLKV